MSTYYFAFGSNMNQNRMKERGVEFTKMFKGSMSDWQLVFNKINDRKEGAGFANIVPKESSIVEGIIYEVNEDSIQKLDVREGFPNHYQRLEMPVWDDMGGFFKCATYIANPNKIKEDLKPEKWYLNHLLEGKEFLSENYFSDLKNIETLD